jgi:hypothetical protein
MKVNSERLTEKQRIKELERKVRELERQSWLKISLFAGWAFLFAGSYT